MNGFLVRLSPFDAVNSKRCLGVRWPNFKGPKRQFVKQRLNTVLITGSECLIAHASNLSISKKKKKRCLCIVPPGLSPEESGKLSTFLVMYTFSKFKCLTRSQSIELTTWK